MTQILFSKQSSIRRSSLSDTVNGTDKLSPQLDSRTKNVRAPLTVTYGSFIAGCI